MSSRRRFSPALDAFKVYFIEAVGLNVIKIGYARDIGERIRKLRPGCPAPLRLLGTAPGGLSAEQEFHRTLAAHRIHGEWFRRCPELEKVLAGIDAPQPFAPPLMRRSRRLILEDHRTAAQIAARM
jgi:hypothetical protein